MTLEDVVIAYHEYKHAGENISCTCSSFKIQVDGCECKKNDAKDIAYKRFYGLFDILENKMFG